jgi:hypothetical protein
MPRKGMGFFDQKRTSFETFDLHEGAEPNLYRNISTYQEACKIEFDNKDVFIDPSEEMFITGTTFRDGQQARSPCTVKQIMDLFEMLQSGLGTNYQV